MRCFGDFGIVDAHFACTHGFGSQGAGFKKARVPKPFINADF